MIGGKLFGPRAPALLDGGARGQALETVAVEAAGAGEVVILSARQDHVSHLQMHETVDGLAPHDRTTPDAGADSEVDEIVETAGRAPPALA